MYYIEKGTEMTARVTVVGGGYGGVTVAKALDEVADVTLVEPRDAFVHNVATLRAVVDPEWANRLFLPYDALLAHGRVVRDRTVGVTEGAVTLASGVTLASDYIVLATGSTVPHPAKIEALDAAAGTTLLAQTHDELVLASRVLLLGAGPIGLELAGEIAAAWPEKKVVIVDRANDVLSGRFPDEFRAEVRKLLAARDIELALGSALSEAPPSEAGHFQPFLATTESGREIEADVWFACYGAAPESGYLAAGGEDVLRPTGHVAVDSQLRVVGRERVFAIGDITDVPELKMGRLAQKHAEVVARNIRADIEGRHDLVSYEPEADSIVLPLGPQGGASYSPEVGVLGAEMTSDIKGNLYLDLYRDLLGLSEVSA